MKKAIKILYFIKKKRKKKIKMIYLPILLCIIFVIILGVIIIRKGKYRIEDWFLIIGFSIVLGIGLGISYRRYIIIIIDITIHVIDKICSIFI